MHSFAVHAFGCRIQAAAECEEAYKALECYVFPSLPRLAEISDPPDISIRICVDEGGYQLLADGVAVASASSLVYLVPHIIRVLDDAVIARLEAMRAVHAGTVLWNGRVLLLPGISHAGKSSLVAELLRRGATYFSDEYALIDAEGRVHPYPRPLLVRNGGPEQSPVLAGECGAATGDAPAPVGWILALQYRSESAWKIQPMSQGEGLLMLLQNTPHVLAEAPEMVEIFQNAVVGASCFAGLRPDAVQAASQILSLIEGHS